MRSPFSHSPHGGPVSDVRSAFPFLSLTFTYRIVTHCAIIPNLDKPEPNGLPKKPRAQRSTNNWQRNNPKTQNLMPKAVIAPGSMYGLAGKNFPLVSYRCRDHATQQVNQRPKSSRVPKGTVFVTAQEKFTGIDDRLRMGQFPENDPKKIKFR